MTRDQIVKQVSRIFIEEFEIEESILIPQALLREDLDLDSLDAVDMIVAFEKAFNCRISEEEARQITSLSQIHDCIASLKAAA